jgi:acetyl-CoA carboxylase biotin carboxyl carrier protein
MSTKGNNNNFNEYKNFIEDLSKIINQQDISEITFKQNDIEVLIKKNSTQVITQTNYQQQPIQQAPNPVENYVSPQEPQKHLINDSNTVIKSPMVGIVYLTSSPENPPFVKVGSQVKEGDTILLIEAMKVFNNVKSPKSGIVKEILVTSNQTVEYNDPLIIIE